MDAEKAATDTFRPLSLTNPEGWIEPTVAGVPMSETTALALSAVWGCVNLLAGTIASLPLVVYRTGSDGIKHEAKDHPLYGLLNESPNAEQTSYDFWEGGQSALELAGNMCARKEVIGSRVVSLHPIIKPSIRRVDGRIRYRWTENGRSYDEPAENVLHIRGFGGGPLGGLSTLSYARQQLGLSTAITTAAAATFQNGMRPSGVVSFKDFMTEEQRTPVEKAIVDKYVGAMNAGKPLVLEGGATWSAITITPEDAQMLESRGFGIEEICRFFGVPPFMIGHGEKNSGYPTSLEQQLLMFQTFALRKRIVRNEKAIRKQLLTPADRAAGVTVEYNLEAFLRADSEGRAKFYQIMTQIGAMVINEVRRKENLPPVEGGDVPRMQAQNIPITMTTGAQLVAGGTQQ